MVFKRETIKGSTKMKSLHEKRKHVRVDIFAVARYFDPLRMQETGVQTRIANISEGGALLLTFDRGIPVDMSVLLHFRLPEEKSPLISAEGIIRHTSFLEKGLYRSGMEFHNLSEDVLKAIRKYISGNK